MIGLVPAIMLLLLPIPSGMRGLQNYIPLHSFLEMLAITISVSIFALCLSVNKFRPSSDIRWIGWMFLAVALLDFSHMISYPGMPSFGTPAGVEKAINFWLMARTLAALALLAIATQSLPYQLLLRPALMPIVTLLFVLILHVIFLLDPEAMPRTFIEGQGLTPFKIAFEYGLIALYGAAAILLISRDTANSAQPSRFNTYFLADAALVMALSEFMFTLYGSVTDIYNIYGHILKVAAYWLLFRGFFVQLVRQPYVSLIDLENERSAALKALPDAIVKLDYDGRIHSVLHNTPAFEAAGLSLSPGQPLAASLGPDWGHRFEEAFEKATPGRAHVIDEPYVLHTESGQVRVFVLTVSCLEYMSPRFSGWLVLVRDVSEREFHRLEAERLSNILVNAPVPIAILDTAWRTSFVNRSYRDRFGNTPEDSLPDISFDRQKAELETGRGRSYQCERKWTGQDGTARIDRVYVLPMADPDGQRTGTMIFFEDVTEQRAAEEKIEAMLRYDQLTGLPKQKVLAAQFDETVAADKTTSQTITLLRLNIDDFGRVNAAYGREAGDRVFQLFAENIRSALGPNVLLTRDEGHDLAILLIDMQRHEVPALVSSVLKAAHHPISLGQETIRFTTCIGVACYPDDGETFDALLAATEAALRAAKEQGPGSWNTFSLQLRESLTRFMAVSTHLGEAIRNNELSLVFQPQMTSDGSACCGAEVLIRWESEKLGPVSPEEFIAVAEVTGEIKSVGAWLFRETASSLGRWIAEGRSFPRISINLSAVEFEDPLTVDRLTKIARQAGIDPKLIDVELTERMLIKNTEVAIDTIRDFKAHGFGVALDDFGAGQTSLRYLMQFPVEVLKIDKALVSGIVDDPRSAAVVSSIVDLAHQLGMHVIAEGVETAEQQAAILATHCDAIQGYYFSKPLTEAQFFDLLQRVRCRDLRLRK